MTSIEHRIITKEDLLSKYLTEDWPRKLAGRRCVDWWTGNSKHHMKWFNDDNEVLAFVIEYVYPNRKSTVVRLLRDENVLYAIEPSAIE